MKRFFPVVFTLLCTVITVLYSQESKPEKLDDMVISATRSEIQAADAPQNIRVITAEEIQESPYETVEEIVQNTPGMYNFRHRFLNQNGIISPLQMRGTGKNRVLFLIDGIPQNDNFNNTIAWVGWGHIPKEAIKRIEVVRGPSSALYGSEGLGGAIHIITKDGAEERKTALTGKAGSGSTLGGSSVHSQQAGDFSFVASANYSQSDGFYVTKDPGENDEKRYRDDIRLFGKLGYDISEEAHISAAGLFYNQEGGQGTPGEYTEIMLDQYWLNYSHSLDKLDISTTLFLNRADKETQKVDRNFDPQFVEDFDGSYTWGGDFQATFTDLSPVTLTTGAAYKNSFMAYDVTYLTDDERREGAEGMQQFAAPFVSATMSTLYGRLIFTVGGRYDWIQTKDGANWDTHRAWDIGETGGFDREYDERTDDNISPSLGVVWHTTPNTTLKSSAGIGFRAPSLFEMYKVHVRGQGSSFTRSNPDLSPEKIYSYDIGAEHFFMDNLLGKLTFYQSRGTDYIGSKFIEEDTDAGIRYSQRDNISEVDIYGFEIELDWQPFEELSIQSGYTYNNSKIKSDEDQPDLEGNYLEHDPQHKGNFRVSYHNDRIVNATLNAAVYGDKYYDLENTMKSDAYWSLDGTLSRTFLERFTARLAVENILDEQNVIFQRMRAGEIQQTVDPGRILTASLTYQF
ncbi:TonB-dependent receptor plug domain-containing protein [Chitinivibrio alkaliphilus]|uniref:TonB-dependent receptor n=1 Tax=Chitinivibrio alkaliphilus ACht1 TaxID=1313304 RepID=U7D6V9_9BACT|nr:TonB-dependent receptor [Chitinivibrio alkaliphilus]ERP31673.1 TonB-dependent receptor [Chitinivibrio alkaliphilus ACht1]